MSIASYDVKSIVASDFPDQYRGLIFAKYLRSLRYGNGFYNLIDAKAYYPVNEAYLKTLLARPNAIVRLALLTEDPDIALGWALIEPRKVHYVWVHDHNRKIGIATALLPRSFDTFTHITKIASQLWPQKFPDAKFNPYA